MEKIEDKLILYAIDGDRMGKSIDTFFIQGNLEMLHIFSEKIIQAVEEVKKLVLSGGGDIIFGAGDSVLFRGTFKEEQCKYMQEVYLKITGHTASMGIGSLPIEVYLALKIAKAFGDGKICYYKDLKL